MKRSNVLLRRPVVAAASVVLLAATVQAAPQKPAAAPAIQEAPAPEKKAFSKLKSRLGFKNKAEVPAAAPAAKPAAPVKAKAAPVPAVKPAAPVPEADPPKKGFIRNLFTKGEKPVEKPPVAAVEKTPAASKGAKKVPAEVKPESAAVPEKQGFIKNLFVKKPKAEAPAGPDLASVKTAKPAPVTPAKTGEEPAPKRSFFSFLRSGNSPSWDEPAGGSEVPDSDKIERPADWKDHQVVKEDDIALYEFGPSQSQGPDARLSRGTLLKVKRVEKGWALVEAAGGRTGYIDAAALRESTSGDFKDPAPVVPFMAAVNPEAWAPLAPPPDLPEQPGPMDADASLLLLPPLELERKP